MTLANSPATRLPNGVRQKALRVAVWWGRHYFALCAAERKATSYEICLANQHSYTPSGAE